MAIVAGVDFGTLSVRVSIVDSAAWTGSGSGTAEYPLHRKKDDPDHATQSHADHMNALVAAMRNAIAAAGVDGRCDRSYRNRYHRIERCPRRTSDLQPLDDYYLWCDHRAWREAAQITSGGARSRSSKRSTGAAARTRRSGAWPSCCTGCATIRTSATHGDGAGALRHGGGGVCAASPIPAEVPRSICAMGHKWMWNRSVGGLASREFLTRWIRLLDGLRESSPAGTQPRASRRALCRRMGGEAGLAGGHSDSGWRIRCALGCHRRGLPHRRRGECGRHVDVHHGASAKSRR